MRNGFCGRINSPDRATRSWRQPQQASDKFMICEHLRPVEQAIIARGFRETFRGKAWSDNCREWVYFDCFIDLAAVRQSMAIPVCVTDHIHRGTHDGEERGFVCSQCHDAVMGRYEPSPGGSFKG